MFVALISGKNLAAKELSINALQIEVDKNNQTINAEGKVEILDEEKNSVLTEKAKYNKKEDILTSIGKTEITTSENFKVTGKNISFNNKENVISSQNDAVIVDRNGNKIFVNMFNYLTKKNMFFSKGEIKVVDSKNNEYFFSEIYIDEKKRKIVGADIKAFFNDKSFKSDKRNEPRFFANSATIEKRIQFLKRSLQPVKIEKKVNVLRGLLKQSRSSTIVQRKLYIMIML